MKRLIVPFLMPPLASLLLVAAGLLLLRRRRRTGRALVGIGLGSLLLLSEPFVAAALLIALQADQPLLVEGPLPAADAIVVLGGDLDPGAPEYGGGTVGPLSLQRVRYGAHLARRSGLPVLVTGGRIERGHKTVARLMANALEELGVRATWVEDRAADTRQNARFSAKLLEEAGARRILLVTHAWHLPRARSVFEAAGLEVIAAPTTPRIWPSAGRLSAWLPSARSMQESRWALHEWIGRAWYALSG